MRIFAASLLILSAIALHAVSEAPTVAITGGQIRGAMLETGGAVFKGVPYAAPPVGELRWREPMPVKPWVGVKNVATFGAICPQPPIAFPNAAQLSSEDCLFLNVWTAEWPSQSRKPVMVWMHGGGNYYGASSTAQLDGQSLARHGVVLVSVDYRLGSLGFFSHPALTRESPNHASGNQGVLDQIAALKWVHENIARFGGDPDNVTVFGESAGAFDLSFLMTSPLGKGLFQRVIAQSGTSVQRDLGVPATLSEAEQQGRVLAARWGARAGVPLEELRAVPAEEILKAQMISESQIGPDLGLTIDGFVFAKDPAAVFAAGQQHRVALLLGSNARDRIGPLPETLHAAISQMYGPLAGRAEALYAGDPDPMYGTTIEQWKTDTSFRCSTVAQLAWHAAAGNASFQYEFARVPPGREAIGAHHSLDVAYVFGTLNALRAGGPRANPAQPNAVDQHLSDAMQEYWTNFAKTGDPNGAGLPVWPKFDQTKRAYIQLTDAGPIAKEGLRRPYCDVFIENVKRQMAK